tara:strand:- start:1354 stop:1458 length:105 start_codon:yes stop_codon:yes gene_type:complete
MSPDIKNGFFLVSARATINKTPIFVVDYFLVAAF